MLIYGLILTSITMIGFFCSPYDGLVYLKFRVNQLVAQFIACWRAKLIVSKVYQPKEGMVARKKRGGAHAWTVIKPAKIRGAKNLRVSILSDFS